MKILQLDVDKITFYPVRPEAPIYEDAVAGDVSTVSDAIVILLSIEKGDTNSIVDKAFGDIESFMHQQKREKLVIYPFAHLSSNLAAPGEALQLVNYMYKLSSDRFETTKAPFGWNKKLELSIKAHPLAEQSRTYSPSGQQEKTYKKAKPESVNTSIVKKSDFSGIPETDHRIIGERMNLFSFQEVSPGNVYWHNNGHIIFRELISFIRGKLSAYGYEETSTPTLNNLALWHVSGHYDHYKENMFMLDVGNESMGLKPMNCPSTVMIYKSRKWSYRELPFKVATFDKLYRNEISGALSGLFRVREMTQDDAHIFMAEEQVPAEIHSVIGMIKSVYSTIGMAYAVKLSTMPDNHLGSDELWAQATDGLKQALESHKIPYEVKEKEGAFYGPKIDFEVIDSMDRKWQCATIQLDYQLPIRFGLEYTGADGKQHTPVIMHRALLGTLERFIGVLIEHYQGKFPTWLAPVQTVVIPISEQANEYAGKVYSAIKESGIRSSIDLSDRTLEYKIREAQKQRIPYMVILGKREADEGKITVRSRSGKQVHGLSTEDFMGTVVEEIRGRKPDLSY
ncbi:MAG: threonine--tRNA ligase [Candidatus Marsarchaeota archaeon]|nr:threonine--tRNA ligase [Candidatus Marsarchaeota archaeon]